jgi:hypothetical protein
MKLFFSHALMITDGNYLSNHQIKIICGTEFAKKGDKEILQRGKARTNVGPF